MSVIGYNQAKLFKYEYVLTILFEDIENDKF